MCRFSTDVVSVMVIRWFHISHTPIRMTVASPEHTVAAYLADHYNISVDPADIIYNPTHEALREAELADGMCVSDQGAVAVDTGKFTGRSPRDKYIVKDETTADTVWWTSDAVPNDNKPITPAVFDELQDIVVNQLSGKKLYVVDGFSGASEEGRMAVRFVSELAWQAHFIRNMFIRPTPAQLADFKPSFTVLNGALATNPHYERHGMNSEVFVAFDLTRRVQLIGGTLYAGEQKKGIFSMQNYFLPMSGIASMHCSANEGADGDVALFFGLSGTGKTTLSTDPKRALIGDDEHGWSAAGVFNQEGGCYAKVINLDAEAEPGIYNAIKEDALLENVVLHDKKVDYRDNSKTENTRVSYPIYHIDGVKEPSTGGHATKVIFLTCDAFGVLPPVSVLTKEQTKYHFLSAFTAKVAGTERGVTEPVPVFSPCYGGPFLTLHPKRYAELLVERMDAAGATAFLVNTGWNGTGRRISIKDTRLIIDAILGGNLDDAEMMDVPYFNLAVPKSLAGVGDILDPRNTYQDDKEWDQKARKLAGMFIENFKQFGECSGGPTL